MRKIVGLILIISSVLLIADFSFAEEKYGWPSLTLTSGAYSLGERYDLTVEAFQEYLARLEPGGLLAVQRWLQLPPSETLRAGAAAVEALRNAGVTDPVAQLVVLRGMQTGLILVKNGAFQPEEDGVLGLLALG